MFKFVAGLFLLILVALGATIFYIDTLAKAGIERGATYALGVDTSVDSVSVGLMSGKFGASGLQVANPAGFERPHFLRLGSARVEMPLATLREDTVRVGLVSLDGIDVNIERLRGKSNYAAILDSLGKLESGSKPPPQEGAGKKTFIVDELRISDVKAHLNLELLAGRKSSLEVVIPEIRLQGVGEKSGGASLGELSAVITKAILSAVTKAGGVPSEILGELTSGLRGLADVRVQLPEGIGAAAGKLLEGDAGELGKQLGGDAAGELGKALEGLGGLLGGKKPPAE